MRKEAFDGKRGIGEVFASEGAAGDRNVPGEIFASRP